MNYTTLSDADLNKYFARAFLDRPIDERTNTYWHDDDRTPAEDNNEWRPIPDYVNDWSEVRRILASQPTVIPREFMHNAERCRRAMVWLLQAKKAQP